MIQGPGGYGDFSSLDRYFAVVDWLDAHGVQFDWLQNLTGQDYPLRPIADIEHRLMHSGVDGYLQYMPVFPERTPPDVDSGAGTALRLCSRFDASMRYDYRNRRMGSSHGSQATLAASSYGRQPGSAVDTGKPGIFFPSVYAAKARYLPMTLSSMAVPFSVPFLLPVRGIFATLHVVGILRSFSFSRNLLDPGEVFFELYWLTLRSLRLCPKEGITTISQRAEIITRRSSSNQVSSGHAGQWHDFGRKYLTLPQDSEVLDILDRSVRKGLE